MLNRKRLVDTFLEIVKIDSPSGKELDMANWLIKYLKERGAKCVMDNAGDSFGGNCGNVVAYIEGETRENPICFSAHMDQVSPCENVNAIVDNDIIKTDGKTTLGGDDKGGIAVILEALEAVLEDKKPHRDIYILFTVCEEEGLFGAKAFDSKNLPCKDIVILDAGGDTGVIAYKAPAEEDIKVTFYGKKAHAGIEPEKGINAIVVAAHAISNMNIGRINEYTTSNIGRIEGGGATNIVTDEVTITAEIRSHNPDTLKEQIENFRKCCEDSCEKFNTNCKFETEQSYPSFELDKSSYIYNLVYDSIEKAGVKPNPMIIGGGSDANIIANLGYNCAILSLGMYKPHTVEEYLDINELYKATEIVYNMMIFGEK